MNKLSDLTFMSVNPILPVANSGPFYGYTEKETSKTESKGSKKLSLGLLDSSMIEILEKDGNNPSDVAYFMNYFSDAIDNAYDPENGTVNTNVYKLGFPMLAAMRAEGKALEEARKEAMSKNLFGEIAIGTLGEVYVRTEDGFERTTLEDAKKNKLLGNLLTVEEMFNYRQNDSRFAFLTNMTSIIGNSTGMESVMEYINKQLQGMGKTNNGYEKYYNKEGQELTGTELIKMALSGEDLAQFNITNNSQLQEAAKTLKTLIIGMPSNMKTLLEYKSSLYGSTATDYLTDYVFSKVDLEYKTNLKTVSNDSSSGNSKKNKGIGDEELNSAWAWLQGYGDKERVRWHGSGDFTLDIVANVMALTKNGNDIEGMVPLSQVINSDFGGILNSNLMSFGNSVINPALSLNVLVNGSLLYKMVLPIDLEAALDGIIKPDMKLLDRISEVEKYIRDNKITKPEDINLIYALKRLPVKYSKEYNEWVISDAYCTFGVLNGYATEQAISKDASILDSAVELVTDDNERNGVALFLNNGKSKDDKVLFTPDTHWWRFGFNDLLYKSLVYIPVRNDWANALQSRNKMPTMDQAFNGLEPVQLNMARTESLQTRLNNPFGENFELK